MFTLQVSIYDFPCYWFGNGICFWKAANRFYFGVKFCRFLEIHCEAAIISYAHIEFHLITTRFYLIQSSLMFTN